MCVLALALVGSARVMGRGILVVLFGLALRILRLLVRVGGRLSIPWQCPCCQPAHAPRQHTRIIEPGKHYI